MTDLDKMARELLAKWHLDRGMSEKVARDCRNGVIDIPEIYWELIRTALLAAPPGWKLVPVVPGNEPAPVAIVVEQDTAYSAYPYGIKKLRDAAAHLRTGTLLYAAPQPTQAIDLERALRDLLQQWGELDYPMSYEGRISQDTLDACAADVQALIDGQANARSSSEHSDSLPATQSNTTHNLEKERLEDSKNG